LWEDTEWQDVNWIPTGYLLLLPPGKREKKEGDHYYQPKFSVDSSAGTIDFYPREVQSQSRYPRPQGSYSIPHADTSFAGDELKLKKVLRDLLAGGYVKDSYTLIHSPHWRNLTVGELFQHKTIDPVREIATRTTGEVTFYHGTSKKRWETIRVKGLRPGSPTGFGPDPYADQIRGYSDKNIYLTSSIPEAEKYATRAATLDKSTSVVLAVVVRDLTRFRLDEDAAQKIQDGGTTVFFKGVTHTEVEEDGSIKYDVGDWRVGPKKPYYESLFQAQMLKSLAREKTVAYQGSIPPRDIKVLESYKPIRMKINPKLEEYEEAREKTLHGLVFNPTRVAQASWVAHRHLQGLGF
jgi:hypothetical protein